jgi:hypothetical protein
VNINFLDVFAGRREEEKSALMIEDRAVEADGGSNMSSSDEMTSPVSP